MQFVYILALYVTTQVKDLIILDFIVESLLLLIAKVPLAHVTT